MCLIDPFGFRWSRGYISSSSYCYHQIRSINLSHCCHIYLRLCIWGGCTIIIPQLHHIDPGKVFLPLLLRSLCCSANTWEHHCMKVVLVCLQTTSHYHHYADLSDGIKHIRILVRYIISGVWFSIDCLYAIYGAVCFQLTHLFFDDCSNVCCALSYHHYEIGNIIAHGVELGNETMVWAVCLTMFFKDNVSGLEHLVTIQNIRMDSAGIRFAIWWRGPNCSR